MKRREFITLLGSAAASWPLLAQAQQREMPLIGWLGFGPYGPNSPMAAAFRQGLIEVGYIEGRNVAIDFRATTQSQLLPQLAADLVSRDVAVLVTAGSPTAALTAKAATSTIPVVFVVGDDPRRYGIIGNLGRPGGNVTGMNFLNVELAGKRLNLLAELVPDKVRIAYLTGPQGTPVIENLTNDILAAAHGLGRDMTIVRVFEGNYDAAFASIAKQGARALIVGDYSPFRAPANRNKILQLAADHQIPAIYPVSVFTANGGLMSYGSDDPLALYHRLATDYVGKVLKGTKPADLPVQQPTKFEFVINLKTAKTLGLTIPRVLLATATQVIE
jgi:putative tryptophan/tyrosine transport system substrate-binding protein